MGDIFQLCTLIGARKLDNEGWMSDEHELKEMQERRVQSARLLQSGIHPTEVARRVHVSRQSVMRWLLKSGGLKHISRIGRRG